MCDFKNEFYAGPIDYQWLADDLRMSLGFNSFVFDWSRYRANGFGINNHREYATISQRYASEITSTPLGYKNSEGKVVFSRFAGMLNQTLCKVNQRFDIGVSFKQNQLNFKLVLRYDTPEVFTMLATSTPEENDFSIDPKYIAVELNTDTAEDVLAFIKTLKTASVTVNPPDRDTSGYESVITRHINRFIAGATDGGTLKKLYEQAPLFALGDRDDMDKLGDIKSLLAYDKGNWIVDELFGYDPSNALIKLLRSIKDKVFCLIITTLLPMRFPKYILILHLKPQGIFALY